jgi:translation elongation factor P/translation initiation factor 5A
VVELETRAFEVLCRQRDELLLVDLASGEAIEVPANFWDGPQALQPGAILTVAMYSGRPVRIVGLASPSDE